MKRSNPQKETNIDPATPNNIVSDQRGISEKYNIADAAIVKDNAERKGNKSINLPCCIKPL
jgi:hypothetical protein